MRHNGMIVSQNNILVREQIIRRVCMYAYVIIVSGCEEAFSSLFMLSEINPYLYDS